MTISKKSSKKISRCPFCGGFAVMHGQHSGEGFELFCECGSCGARGKTFYTDSDMYMDDFEEDYAFISALHSWNKRYPDNDRIRIIVKEMLEEDRLEMQTKKKAGDHNG